MKANTLRVSAVASLLVAMGSSPVLAAPASGLAPPPLILPACSISGSAGFVKAVGRSTLYTAHRDFSGGIENGNFYPAGTFGDEPLFKTIVTVGGTTKSCVLATVSVNAQPNDNGMVLQARIDGKPMGGHWNPADFLAGTGNIPSGFNVPIVWMPNVVFHDAVDPPHLAAYTFFASVAPGAHTLEVRVAGCCHQDLDAPANAPDGYIRSATLALQHR